MKGGNKVSDHTWVWICVWVCSYNMGPEFCLSAM